MEKPISIHRIRKQAMDPELAFRLKTMFKLIAISCSAFVLLGGLLWVFLELDIAYFQAHSLLDEKYTSEVFYDFLFKQINGHFINIFMFFIVLVGLSYYVAHLLLRPFNKIKEHCEKRMNGDQVSQFNGDFFTNMRLLMDFSKYFFKNTGHGKVNVQKDLPAEFSGIHSPHFESRFFLHYSLIIYIASAVTCTFLYGFIVDIHDGILQLAYQVLTDDRSAIMFLSRQKDILQNIISLVLGGYFFIYGVFAFHLYGLVAPPAFALFATMRSFIKGNSSTRVHLIGYQYVRQQCRTFNKYLDSLQKNNNESHEHVA